MFPVTIFAIFHRFVLAKTSVHCWIVYLEINIVADAEPVKIVREIAALVAVRMYLATFNVAPGGQDSNLLLDRI